MCKGREPASIGHSGGRPRSTLAVNNVCDSIVLHDKFYMIKYTHSFSEVYTCIILTALSQLINTTSL